MSTFFFIALRTILVPVLIVSFLQLSIGQTAKADFGSSDPAAQAVLDKMKARYESFKTMRAVFTLTIDAPEDDVNEEQSGMIYLKGNKYHLELEGTNIVCDNTTRWIHTTDPCEIQINY